MQPQDPIWITSLFDYCVNLLVSWGNAFGISYEAINIYLFCIAWPILTLLLVITVIIQHIKIRSLTD